MKRSFESRPFSMPAKSQSGETQDDDLAAALEANKQDEQTLNGRSRSMDRSSSFQHGGIFKRNRYKPRKRVLQLSDHLYGATHVACSGLSDKQITLSCMLLQQGESPEECLLTTCTVRWTANIEWFNRDLSRF